MARIENQGVYPLKANPVSTDYVIGTDSQDNNKTVSFSISAFQAAVGATIYTNSNTIPEDRVVTHVGLLSFTGNTATSQFIAQHTNGHVLRVNQDGVFGTSMGIGTLSNNPSAILQVDSTTRGFLAPRMTEAQRDLIASPANGLLIYNTDSNLLEFYNGSNWISSVGSNIYTSNGVIDNTSRQVTGTNASALDMIFNNLGSSTFTQRGRFVVNSLGAILAAQSGNGSGVVTAQSLLVIDNTTMAIEDGINSRGLVYAANYSANYTNRSLVDKEYVDSVAGATIYTSDGEITNTSRSVVLLDTDDSGEEFSFKAVGTSAFSAALLLTYNTVRIEATSAGGSNGITITPSQMLVQDIVNQEGLVYAADYRSNFTARSLVDKGYVDSAVGTTFYTGNGTINATSRTVIGTGNTSITTSLYNTLASNFTQRGQSRLSPTLAGLSVASGNGLGAVSAISEILITSAAMTVEDTINKKGLVYAANYAANFTDRSLIDKAYVDAKTVFTTITRTTAYSANVRDFILADASSAAFTVTLPLASSSTNQVIAIKKIDATANAVTIDGNGSETIDGSLTLDITVQYELIKVISNGVSWFIF